MHYELVYVMIQRNCHASHLPHRLGCFLRGGGTRRRPFAGGQARGRWRTCQRPRRRNLRLLRGPSLRFTGGYAPIPGPSSLPTGRLSTRELSEIYGSVGGFHQILESYSPFVQPLSLDEAFVDMTGFESLYGSLNKAAKGMKGRVRSELKITASVGIASSKVAAKVASELEKPMVWWKCPRARTLAFSRPMPVADLPGVGAKSAKLLEEALGVKLVGELAATPAASLRSVFGVRGTCCVCGRGAKTTLPFMVPRPPSPSDGRPLSTRTQATRPSCSPLLLESGGAGGG